MRVPFCSSAWLRDGADEWMCICVNAREPVTLNRKSPFQSSHVLNSRQDDSPSRLLRALRQRLQLGTPNWHSAFYELERL